MREIKILGRIDHEKMGYRAVEMVPEDGVYFAALSNMSAVSR